MKLLRFFIWEVHRNKQISKFLFLNYYKFAIITFNSCLNLTFKVFTKHVLSLTNSPSIKLQYIR